MEISPFLKEYIPPARQSSHARQVFDLAEAYFVVKSSYAVFGSLFEWQVPGGTDQLINSNEAPPVRGSRKA
jgi:hypothetical protein